MSQNIRIYESVSLDSDESKLSVTAYVGKEEQRKNVQFTIGFNYVSLSEIQTLDLISALAQRLGGLNNHNATSDGALVVMKPDGSVGDDE